MRSPKGPTSDIETLLDDLTDVWSEETRRYFLYHAMQVLDCLKYAYERHPFHQTESVLFLKPDTKEEQLRMRAAEHLAFCIEVIDSESVDNDTEKNIERLYRFLGCKPCIDFHTDISRIETIPTVKLTEDKIQRMIGVPTAPEAMKTLLEYLDECADNFTYAKNCEAGIDDHQQTTYLVKAGYYLSLAVALLNKHSTPFIRPQNQLLLFEAIGLSLTALGNINLKGVNAAIDMLRTIDPPSRVLVQLAEERKESPTLSEGEKIKKNVSSLIQDLKKLLGHIFGYKTE